MMRTGDSPHSLCGVRLNYWDKKMIIYVGEGAETWTLNKPTPVVVTDTQFSRIESGQKVYTVVPDWAERSPIPCNCVACTTARQKTHLIIQAQTQTKDKP